MVGFASAMPFIPLFIADKLGIVDPGPRGAVVASFSFAATLGYGIFNPLWGMLSDRIGVKPMLLRGTFLAGLTFPLMAWTTTSWQLVAVRFVSAAMAGTTAASQILVAKVTPEERGTVFGVQSTAQSIGIMLSTVASGALVYRLGSAPATVAWSIRGTFAAACALSLLFIPLCIMVSRRASAK